MTSNSAYALSLSAVQDQLKDIELAYRDADEGFLRLIQAFLDSVQSLTQNHFSQAGVERKAALDELELIRQKVGSFAGDDEQLEQYLVINCAALPYYLHSLCLPWQVSVRKRLERLMEPSCLCKPSTSTSGTQDSAQTDLRSGRADPRGLVWDPDIRQAPAMMRHLKAVDRASGYTVATFCNQIKEAWFALGYGRWPDRQPQGKELDVLFRGLCRELEKTQKMCWPR